MRLSEVIRFFLVVSILSAMNISCSTSNQAVSKPNTPVAEPAPIDNDKLHNEMSVKYKDLIQQLQRVTDSYYDLERFRWERLDEVGYWEVQASGACCATFQRVYKKTEPPILARFGHAKWISVQETLPNKTLTGSLGLVIKYCNECSKQINPDILFQSSSKDTTNPTSSEWDKNCAQLSSTLHSAFYQVKNMNGSYQSQFGRIIGALDAASPSTKNAYLDRFKQQANEFTNLLQQMMTDIDQAANTIDQIISLKPK